MSSRLRTDRSGQSVGFIEFNSGANADRAMEELQVRPSLARPPPLSAARERIRSHARGVRRVTSSMRRTRGSTLRARRTRAEPGTAQLGPRNAPGMLHRGASPASGAHPTSSARHCVASIAAS